MSNLQSRLRPNSEEVAAKVLDGEAIMINLSNGTYYSMDGVGGFVWGLLEGGRSLGEIVSAIATRYDVSQEQAQADVERLAAELVEENLVMLSGDEAPWRGEQHRLGLPSAQAQGSSISEASLGTPQQELDQQLAYEPPLLNIYRDMADLLALDPPMPGLSETPWE